MLQIREINTKKDKKRFVKFPIELYKNNPYFVPQMIADEMENFNPKHNAAYEYAESHMFLAERDGKIVGRVAVILNKAYNVKINARQLRFTRFDFIDDFEVSQALFDQVKKMAKLLDLNEIIGPIGFSDLDKQGLLIEGFESMNMYVTTYNSPYYITHYEKLGLTKKVDWVEYKIKVPSEPIQRWEQTADAIINRYHYQCVTFNKIKDIKPYIIPALKVMNEAFEKLFGVVTLSDRQLQDFSKELLLVGHPDYVSLILNSEGAVVGYGFMAPSISKALQKNRGRLTPICIWRLMHELKTSKTLDFYSIGVKNEYRNKGVNVIILRDGLRGAIKNGIEYCETGPELEFNHEVQSQWKMFERTIHKRRRCYTLSLNQ